MKDEPHFSLKRKLQMFRENEYKHVSMDIYTDINLEVFRSLLLLLIAIENCDLDDRPNKRSFFERNMWHAQQNWFKFIYI